MILTGGKCQVYGAISYIACGKITPFKMIWTESVHGHCFSGHNFHNLHPRVMVFLHTSTTCISFFPSDSFFILFF